MIFRTPLIFIILNTVVNIQGQNIQERYFDQKLDHNGKYPGTWKQRYLENRDFFKPGGPVFIRFGGPAYSPVTPSSLQGGSMVQYAKEQSANVIVLESRYYGKSRPTQDLSTPNFEKFNTFQQAIDDSSNFLAWLKAQPDFKSSKIVAFGPLFQGAKINRIMVSNSTLIDIGVMSSPPVEVKFDLPEYLGTAAKELVQQNPECATSVHEALVCFKDIASGETCEGHNLADLKETFNLCDELDPKNKLDSVSLMFETLRLLTRVMLTNNPDPQAVFNVEKACKILGDTSQGLSHMDKLAKVVKQILAINQKKCFDFRFENIVQKLQKTEWDTPETLDGERTIRFLRCNDAPFIESFRALEIGDEKNDVGLIFKLELCKRVFNLTPEQIMKNTERTNQIYGHREFPSQCGIFISGTENLFRAITVTSQKEVGNCNRFVTIPGGSFARDLTEIMPEGMSHPPGLRDAQLKVGNLINEWLRNGNCCMPEAKQFYNSASFIYPVFK